MVTENVRNKKGKRKVISCNEINSLRSEKLKELGKKRRRRRRNLWKEYDDYFLEDSHLKKHLRETSNIK